MNSRSGFTVLEMVIVIVVIGLLLGIAVPKYANFRDSANLAAAKGNIAALRSAASMYYGQQAVETGRGVYPRNKAALEDLLEEELMWPVGYSYTYDRTSGEVTLRTP